MKINEKHIQLAIILAKKKKRRVNKSIYYEELESAAFYGLVDAATKYEESKGPFDQYAFWRINGEMDNYIRDLNWSRRSSVKVGKIKESFPAKEDNQILDNLISLLPEHGQKLFKLYYEDKFTMDQIGKKLGVSESMISLYLGKYLNSLRKRQDEIFQYIY